MEQNSNTSLEVLTVQRGFAALLQNWMKQSRHWKEMLSSTTTSIGWRTVRLTIQTMPFIWKLLEAWSTFGDKLIQDFPCAMKRMWRVFSLTSLQKINFEQSLDTLFDITLCQCKLPLKTHTHTKDCMPDCDIEALFCECAKEKKVLVPLAEREYLKDQWQRQLYEGLFN